MSIHLGIIGYPVAHSLSPVIQGAALAACGLDATYERWDTPPATLSARIAKLRQQGCLGANITIPYKEAVLPLLDEVSALAKEIAAVNTVVNREGYLSGHNTDAGGLLAALAEVMFEPKGMRFLLIGAGGAARAVAFALANAGAAKIGIVNRNADRAEILAEAVSAATGVSVSGTGHADLRSSYDCVVNCTPIGMEGTGTEEDLPCDIRGVASGTLVVDIVYAPEETAFIRAARAAGLPTLNGLPMLIYQGALAFELWTGRPAPLEVMRIAAAKALTSDCA